MELISQWGIVARHQRAASAAVCLTDRWRDAFAGLLVCLWVMQGGGSSQKSMVSLDFFFRKVLITGAQRIQNLTRRLEVGAGCTGN